MSYLIVLIPQRSNDSRQFIVFPDNWNGRGAALNLTVNLDQARLVPDSFALQVMHLLRTLDGELEHLYARMYHTQYEVQMVCVRKCLTGDLVYRIDTTLTIGRF